VEIPELALSIGGGLGAVIATVVVILNRNATTHKAEPQKMEVTEHDCIRKADLEAIRARLEAGSITFAEMQTKLGRVQSDVESLSSHLRELETTLARLLGRLDQ
jgi:predicted  nucleic acid-binding Zn-ribbon protein